MKRLRSPSPAIISPEPSDALSVRSRRLYFSLIISLPDCRKLSGVSFVTKRAGTQLPEAIFKSFVQRTKPSAELTGKRTRPGAIDDYN